MESVVCWPGRPTLACPAYHKNLPSIPQNDGYVYIYIYIYTHLHIYTYVHTIRSIYPYMGPGPGRALGPGPGCRDPGPQPGPGPRARPGAGPETIPFRGSWPSFAMDAMTFCPRHFFAMVAFLPWLPWHLSRLFAMAPMAFFHAKTITIDKQNSQG